MAAEHIMGKSSSWAGIGSCTIVALGLASTAAAQPAGLTATEVPVEVRALLARRFECYHWAGEDPYDADRAKHIARAIARLGCQRLERDEAALRRRYATSSGILDALDEARRRTDADQ
jgi:hypothetical protein